MAKSSLPDLETFAKEKIGADNYPDDVHIYAEANCEKCGIVPFEVILEHWNGDSPVDFYGVIRLRCSVCGKEKEYLSITEEGGKLVYREQYRCKCDNHTFYVASCDRIEVWEGKPCFFDEGVVVGKCSRCGLLLTIAMTD
ncbi:MAG: hypothetical protein Q6352_009500 [Candidatus Freyrarchaeum guaymaensis]|nr:hypothetical protein [Candidatus Sigynarchaeota archaeon]